MTFGTLKKADVDLTKTTGSTPVTYRWCNTQCIDTILTPDRTHPPSPVMWGFTTPKQNTAATAASTALPPLFMMSVPICEQTALSVATLPWGTSCKYELSYQMSQNPNSTHFTVYLQATFPQYNKFLFHSTGYTPGMHKSLVTGLHGNSAAAPDIFMFSACNMFYVTSCLISFEEQLQYRCLDAANYRQ
jgi:hypothetical protein